MRKSIKEYSIAELSNLEHTLENLPSEVNNHLHIDGREISIDKYIREREEEFFNVPSSAFEKIVGKTYVNKDFNVIFKVVGYNPHDPREFYFEQYERYKSGWELKDCIWLEKGKHDWLKEYYTEPGALEAFEQWENDPNVDMNVGAEGMYLLGADGNMYVDYSCGGDYEVYTPTNDNGGAFSLIKDSIKSLNN